MIMTQPYHKYVFDAGRREFVGKFEEMYRGEAIEGYDSWFQESLTSLPRQLSLAMLGRYNFNRVLDIGCGKGAFTHLLKKSNNHVLGVDISETAISKAKTKYPDIDFRVMSASRLSSLAGEPFDLVVATEILSYLGDWRAVIHTISTMTRYFYLTLYLPTNPIGFVKSFDELTAEVSKHFVVETELILNRDDILLFSRTKV